MDIYIHISTIPSINVSVQHSKKSCKGCLEFQTVPADDVIKGEGFQNPVWKDLCRANSRDQILWLTPIDSTRLKEMKLSLCHLHSTVPR